MSTKTQPNVLIQRLETARNFSFPSSTEHTSRLPKSRRKRLQTAAQLYISTNGIQKTTTWQQTNGRRLILPQATQQKQPLPNVPWLSRFLPLIVRSPPARQQFRWLLLHTSSHGCWLNFLFRGANSIKLEFSNGSLPDSQQIGVSHESMWCHMSRDWDWDWPGEYRQAPGAMQRTSATQQPFRENACFLHTTTAKTTQPGGRAIRWAKRAESFPEFGVKTAVLQLCTKPLWCGTFCLKITFFTSSLKKKTLTLHENSFQAADEEMLY